MLFNKPLTEIEESDLQMLVDNTVREGREVEYKQVLTIQEDDQKQEFLNDVSSFANTTGGYLIYGIRESKEDKGKPVEVCGLKGENPGKNIIDMENIIRTGLDPQLYGVSIRPVLLPSHEGRTAIILHIPQSYALPHMVKTSGRFYARNSVGKFPLDVAQLRNAFGLAGTAAERIRLFRIERLSKIGAGVETPVLLDEQTAKIVLHMIPLSAFSTTISVNIGPLYDGIKGELFNPLTAWDIPSTVDMRFNVDGIMRSVSWGNPPSIAAYTQVFRNGIIETVDMSILGINAWNADTFGSKVEKKSFGGVLYEKMLLEAVKRYTNLQMFLGVDPPFFITVSFLGVKGYRISHPTFKYNPSPYTREIDRINLIIPEVILDSFDADVATVMRPIFDTVWNAAGFICSPNYDSAGKFTKVSKQGY